MLSYRSTFEFEKRKCCRRGFQVIVPRTSPSGMRSVKWIRRKGVWVSGIMANFRQKNWAATLYFTRSCEPRQRTAKTIFSGRQGNLPSKPLQTVIKPRLLPSLAEKRRVFARVGRFGNSSRWPNEDRKRGRSRHTASLEADPSRHIALDEELGRAQK